MTDQSYFHECAEMDIGEPGWQLWRDNAALKNKIQELEDERDELLALLVSVVDSWVKGDDIAGPMRTAIRKVKAL